MLIDGAVRYYSDLEPLLTNIDSVRQHPENYNCGDLEAIAESIEVNGMYRPIYVQSSTGYIIAGNHTWEACKHLGAQKIPVVRLDCDDEEALRVMLADNQTASLAKPDNGQLMVLLDRLAQRVSVQGPGVAEEGAVSPPREPEGRVRRGKGVLEPLRLRGDDLPLGEALAGGPEELRGLPVLRAHRPGALGHDPTSDRNAGA